MILTIPGGTFDQSEHIYRDTDGRYVPSLTQVLKLQGLSDYGNIDPAVLENAARRGSEVHELAAAYNQHGEVDPTWISDETRPYFDSYLEFLSDTGFRPDPSWAENSTIATVYGFKFGVTLDCFGKLRRDDAVIEFKCASTVQDSWSIQTSLQECAVYKSNRCGRARRFALMLKKKGRAQLHEHLDHEDDLANGIAALRNCHRRLRAGQRLWERV